MKTQMRVIQPLYIAAALTVALFSSPLMATEIVKRYAIIVAANDGGADRVPLRYAETDALALTKVLQELGGLKSKNRLLLLEPSPNEIISAISQVQKQISNEKTKVKRSELFFYYSGHSNEKGLLLGEDQLEYGRLKNALTQVSSDVQIAVLDSCASGAFARIKGGRHNPPFMQDESSNVKGYAFLTSSSASENAQESDAVGGSYFTHYFVSALRGAADTTLDKKVTLNEAYQYAFHETLARTEQSQSGAQHAAYDFKLAGAGDLVLTELNNSVASIQLEKELGGRLYVRDQSGRLVVEINKIPGLYVEVSLPPQTYLATLDKQGLLYKTAFTISKNQKNTLNFGQFHQVDPEKSVARGSISTSSSPPTIQAISQNLPQSPSDHIAEDEMSISELIRYKTNARRKEIHGVFEQVPMKFSLMPGFSIPGKNTTGQKDISSLEIQVLGSDSDMTNNSIGLLASTVKEDVLGAQIAGIWSNAGGNIHGAQISGIVSNAKGHVYGGQVGGIISVNSGGVDGGQVSGIVSITNGDLRGGQVAAITSITTGNVKGGQVAAISSITGGDVKGGQGAAIANIAGGDVSKFQWSGILNIAGGNTDGAQISTFLNITGGTNSGAQVGVLNIANQVNKMQLGLLNVANKNDGIAFGLINAIGNGRVDIDIHYDESEYNNLTIRSGAQHIYNHFSYGKKNNGDDDYARIRWGVGFSKKYSHHFSQDYEAMLSLRVPDDNSFHDENTYKHYPRVLTIGSNLSYAIIPKIKIVAGLSINALIKKQRGDLSKETYFGKETDKIWPGATLGLRISL